ncbi:TonB-dependent receptor [Sphingomonas sp.]|uniref:TonB-dependent receptor n=1 Tax=Sphingomonas sp. TaxID=28214 RepID=UPI0035BC3599
MTSKNTTRRQLLRATAMLGAMSGASFAGAAEPAKANVAPVTSTGPTVPADDQTRQTGLAEGSDIVVTATRPNEIAPVTASLQTTQPQSVISRSFIEDSLPATSDFNQIALISPSVSNTGSANGAGLSESKAQIRGFQDGEYNITYDGVPFGDTNDPTHHPNTFFPSNTIETLIVDRGPGNAGQLGQATFGGNINLFSRAAREEAGLEAKASYGTFDTVLVRGLLQTGEIDRLGGARGVFSSQAIHSDGARTFSPFRSFNIFGKVVIPVGPSARLTLLGTYNVNRFNQPDNDGATTSQVALYGKQFSLNADPNSQTFYGYNHTHKRTDFEIVRFDADLGHGSTFDNRAYTYSYDNETLSGNDVTLFATATPAQIAAANTVVLTPGAKAVSGVPGYTKTNRYRVFGDIARVHLDFGFGALTTGAWLEWSNTYRQQRDVNLVTLAANFIEKAVVDPVSGTGTPQNVKFDQNSHTNHTEAFVELELRPLPGLSITPGFKHVDFNRQIRAAYNQTTRYAQSSSDTYTADLPFLTVNYALTDRLAAYGQYARGFLAPPLSVLYVANPRLSTVAPERSTNYQAGAVYHGANLSLDADVYRIDFSNKFSSFTSAVPGEGVVFINQGAVRYRGVEAQATYALPLGFAVFANGSRNEARTDNPGVIRQQVAKAPEYTAAGGLLYKHGPIRFSLIDKWVGRQFFLNPTGSTAPGTAYDSDIYQSRGYNAAILSARYDVGPVRLGVEVNNIFDSQRVTSISTGKTAQFDQYFYQAPRAVTGDVTVSF